MLRTADIVEDLLAEGLDDDIRALAALNVDRYADDPRREWNHEDIPFLADRAISFLEDRIVSVRDELACTQDPNADQDGDGYACSLDCDEGNPQIFFGAREICGNSVDEDCSGYYDDSDDCPDCVLDETVVGRPIHVCRVGRSYAAAQTNCASLGARLAAPRDASDNANLFERAGRRLGEQPIWIGLDDTGPEGTYRFSDGRTWSAGRASPYTAWAEGEPNDAGGNEDCAHFLGHAAEWNDIPCDFAFASICEPL
jgi:hypothetical protein